MKVGIFSGTFDPVHQAHLEIARRAISDVGADQVWFLPEPKPRGKVDVAPLNDRLNMLKLATEDLDSTNVFQLEEDFHTIETLRRLKVEGDYDFLILVGADVAKTIQKWEEVDRVFELAKIVSFGRDGEQADIHLDLPSSSKTIRDDIRSGKQPDYLPKKVLEYIHEHNLYQS